MLHLVAINGYFCVSESGSKHLHGNVVYRESDASPLIRAPLKPTATGSEWAHPETGELIAIGLADPLAAASFLAPAKSGKPLGKNGDLYGDNSITLVGSDGRDYGFRPVLTSRGDYRVLGFARALPKGFRAWQPNDTARRSSPAPSPKDWRSRPLKSSVFS